LLASSEIAMRLLASAVVLLVPVLAAAPLCAQPKQPATNPADTGSTVRYFRFNDLLGDISSDAILKETRRGETVTSAVLDLCYPVSSNSQRKERFVVTLNPEGGRLTGTGQTQDEKLPVRVQLVRSADGDDFSFEGTITRGANTTAVSSDGNSDQSEADFLAGETAGDPPIATAPSDFSEVSPGHISVRFKRQAFDDLIKTLRGEDVKLVLDSLAASCEELRSGEQTIRLEVDPERAPALVGKLKSVAGVTAAGWTSGSYSIAYAVRLTAASWRAGGAIDRSTLAAAIAASVARSLSATLLSSQWNATTGALTLKFKRPNPFPKLGLTDTVAVTFLAGPERPAFNDALVVWTGTMSFTTADEGPEPRLSFTPADGEVEAQPDGVDLDTVVTALARDLGGKRWDSENSVWQP
jgi:hypothetical protein